MNILNETEYKLLNRKAVTLEIAHDKKTTPKNEDIKREVASFLKIPEELIVIKHIYTEYGTTNSKIIAHVYKTKEELDRTEFKKKKPRKKKEKKAAPKK